VAEAAILRRPWHGACDRPQEPAVAVLRLQRAEVEALLAFRHTAPGEAESLAWWRLQFACRARLRLLSDAERAALASLPAPPAQALSRWQRVKLRLGRLSLDREEPPRGIARRLGG
jgi:hypothetical protein